MTDDISLRYAWLPLPPAPLNYATILTAQSIDNETIFAWDGEHCSLFVVSALKWTEPQVFTTALPGSNSVCVSQLYNGRFLVFDIYSVNFFVMNENCSIAYHYVNYLSDCIGVFGRFGIGGYTNDFASGIQFPMFPGVMFAGCTNTHGGSGTSVNYIMIEIATGKPLAQYNFETSLTAQGFYTNGALISLGINGYYFNSNGGTTPPYIGPLFLSTKQIQIAIKNSEYDQPPNYGSATLLDITNDKNYFCPAFEVTAGYVTYTIAEFFANTLDAVAGQVSDRSQMTSYFAVQANNDGTITYIPYEFYTDDLSAGKYDLPITAMPPTVIPPNTYNGNYLALNPGIISNGRLYGYFFPDYSGGYYLGIARGDFFYYDMNNYMRRDSRT